MAQLALPSSWDRPGLASVGFTGFVPISGLDLKQLPRQRGIYVILRESTEPPVFLSDNPVKKSRVYSREMLSQKWLVDQTVIYIGKADPIDGIFGRLGAFARRSSSHSGGRAIWQLQDADQLLAAWVETADQGGAEAERIYLDSFKRQHGHYPFANWRG